MKKKKIFLILPIMALLIGVFFLIGYWFQKEPVFDRTGTLNITLTDSRCSEQKTRLVHKSVIDDSNGFLLGYVPLGEQTILYDEKACSSIVMRYPKDKDLPQLYEEYKKPKVREPELLQSSSMQGYELSLFSSDRIEGFKETPGQGRQTITIEKFNNETLTYAQLFDQNIADRESSQPEEGASIAIGNSSQGKIAGFFDIDFFRFQVLEEGIYEVQLKYEVASPSPGEHILNFQVFDENYELASVPAGGRFPIVNQYDIVEKLSLKPGEYFIRIADSILLKDHDQDGVISGFRKNDPILYPFSYTLSLSKF